MELRNYQDLAINDIRTLFKQGKKKVLLVSPTGSGKTVIACAMIQKALEKNKQCLFVAHRRELVYQTINKLYDNGITSGVLMSGQPETQFENVQVASIQTFTARKNNEYFNKPKGDLIILDEAHRSTSKSFKSLIEMYPDSYIIGLTATPIRNDGQGLGNVYEEIVECGTVKSLQQQGYLVNTKYFAPTLPDLSKIQIVQGDYDKKQLSKRMNTTKLVGDLVQHYIDHANNRPTVVFASSVAHSKYIAKMFQQNGIKAGHIDGSMQEIERETVLNAMKNDNIQVLCNCMVLTEGWNLPKISSIILARPTKSLGLWLQMIGRSLRPYKNKDHTIIFDHAGCIYEGFGFPDDDRHWELTVSKEKKQRKKKNIEPIMKQPFSCVRCDFIYKPTKDNPECPNCSFKPTQKEVQLLIKQGRLKQMQKPKETSAHDKKNWYAQLVYIAKQKGYNIGWSSHKFKDKFGHFPHSKQVIPIQPTKEVLGFIKHLQIKQAKSKRFKSL